LGGGGEKKKKPRNEGGRPEYDRCNRLKSPIKGIGKPGQKKKKKEEILAEGSHRRTKQEPLWGKVGEDKNSPSA